MANPLEKVSYGSEGVFRLGEHTISLRHRRKSEDETPQTTYVDGTTETISPDSWDWSEFSGEIWREAGVLYVRLGNEFPSANLTMRATYTSNAGGDNPTVYNLSHTVIVHSAQ